jgi:hypothetical protein
VIKAKQICFLLFARFLVFNGRLFPEDDGARLLALADTAAKLRHLTERDPKRRFIHHGQQQKDIDAAIRMFADEVPGQPGSCFPRLLPWDGALLKQGGDAVGDSVIRWIFHCDIPVVIWL